MAPPEYSYQPRKELWVRSLMYSTLGAWPSHISQFNSGGGEGLSERTAGAPSA